MAIHSAWEKPLYAPSVPPQSFNGKDEEDLIHSTANLSLDEKKPAQEFNKLDRICVIKNVHRDDIHALIKFKDTIISGSKDGSLKQWNFKHEKVTNKTITSPPYINYKNWITALVRINDTHWLSGTRNGHVILWDTKNSCKDLEVQHGPFPNSQDPRCKERNINRVNCLASFPFSTDPKDPQFIVGWPTQFTFHTFSRRLSYNYTSVNDWVYAIQPISVSSLLVVTGCRLDIYMRKNGTQLWRESAKLVKEEVRQDSVRPYISAITPLQKSPSYYGLAVFDGSVRVYDLENQKQIYRGEEHQHRVWTIENISSDCFASCADDGYIKLWDMRQAKAAFSIVDNQKEKSRVSVLMLLEENKLLSGSCPDKVKTSNDKAQFSLWDLRKL